MIKLEYNREIVENTHNKTKGKQVHHYTFTEILGAGTFGEVWKAVDNITSNFVAIKVISKIKNSSIEAQTLIAREISILKSLDHAFIAKLLDHIEDDVNHYLVIEYCQNGSLLDLVVSTYDLDEKKKDKKNSNKHNSQKVKSHLNQNFQEIIKRIFAQIIAAVSYLHDNIKILHRDLKLENIMLDQFYNVRIIDFGLSAFTSSSSVCEDSSGKECDQYRESFGTLLYSAPEVIRREKYNEKVDIWSLGVLLYAMVAGEMPFYNQDEILNKNVDFQKIESFQNRISRLKEERSRSKHRKKSYRSLHSEINQTFVISDALKDIISKMLDKNSETRASIDDIINHPWFPSFEYKQIMNYINSQATIDDIDFEVDQAIIQQIENYGFDCESLSQNLFLHENDEVTSLYFQLSRNKDAQIMGNKFSSILHIINENGHVYKDQPKEIKRRTKHFSLIMYKGKKNQNENKNENQIEKNYI